MTALPNLLATLPTYPTTGESIAFQFTGLMVVFCALGSIWIVMEVMGSFFRRFAAAPPTPAKNAPLSSEAVADQSPAAHQSPAVIDPVITAVIAAAIHHTLGAGHRVVAINHIPGPADWSREGRRDIFTSHRVR